MSTSAVYITVPKFVAITPHAAQLPKIRPAPMVSHGLDVSPRSASPARSSGYASSTCSGTGDEIVGVPKTKKRRLDHLTWEEKVQRKKLKNRVAAQTSRDRKKARMEEMEKEIKDLSQKTSLLQNKCESLQAINDSLLEKNHKLDTEVELLRQQLTELQKKQQQQPDIQSQSQAGGTTCVGCESLFNGSAVSFTDPLQQGSTQIMDSQSTEEQLKKSSTLVSLLRIVALCLLYKTCSSSTKNSMQENWKNLPKACLPISQETWKQAIERAMRMLPKLQAQQSDCLDQWWGPHQNAWNPADIAQAQVAA